MMSHLISPSLASGIWNVSVRRGFKVFMEQRSLLIVKAFEKRAGIKLFDRA